MFPLIAIEATSEIRRPVSQSDHVSGPETENKGDRGETSFGAEFQSSEPSPGGADGAVSDDAPNDGVLQDVDVSVVVDPISLPARKPALDVESVGVVLTKPDLTDDHAIPAAAETPQDVMPSPGPLTKSVVTVTGQELPSGSFVGQPVSGQDGEGASPRQPTGSEEEIKRSGTESQDPANLGPAAGSASFRAEKGEAQLARGVTEGAWDTIRPDQEVGGLNAKRGSSDATVAEALPINETSPKQLADAPPPKVHPADVRSNPGANVAKPLDVPPAFSQVGSRDPVAGASRSGATTAQVPAFVPSRDGWVGADNFGDHRQTPVQLAASTASTPVVQTPLVSQQLQPIPTSKPGLIEAGRLQVDIPRPASLRHMGTPTRPPAPDMSLPSFGPLTALRPESMLAFEVLDRGEVKFVVGPDDSGLVRLSGESFSSNLVSQPQSLASQKAVPGQPTIHSQIAPHFTAAMDGPVEVTLTPEELGRVRMVVTQTEGGVTVQITAERPETLESMRRNIEDLAAELGDLGYSEMTFSFGQDQPDHKDGDHSGESETEIAPAPRDAGAIAGRMAARDRLDIRL